MTTRADREPTAASDVDAEEARERTRRGVMTSTCLMAVISTAFTIGLGATIITRDGLDAALHRVAPWAHVATVVFLLGIAGACRPSLSLRTLRTLDGVATVGSGLGFSLFTVGATAAMGHEWVLLLYMAHALMLRAAVVPSNATRTLSLGAAAFFPTVIQGPLLVVARASSGLASALMTATFALLWIAATLALSTLVSRKIYGLERDVRRARRLGPYTLEEKIGEGGMGEVYKARHALLRRPTAVKVIRPGLAFDHTLARFEREAQLTSLLTHPSTVQVYDFGRGADGTFYYAMEYIEGLTLAELVALDGPQPPGRVATLLASVCDSLAEAHALGLIHRDVKPENVLVCTRGLVPDVVKVLDFGLAKTMESRESGAAGGSRVGTAQYMAPEAVLRPWSVDARTDIYAVGAVAYFLLTGKHVFSGAIDAVLAQQVNTTPMRPSACLGAEVPAALEDIVLRCLAKDPAARPQRVHDLGALLSSHACTWDVAASRAWWQKNHDAIPRARALHTNGSMSVVRALTTRLVA